MPKLYQKKNWDYYTKTAFSGRIITYQITDDGADYLMDRYGVNVKDDFSKDVLFKLIDLNYAYTYGSDPGSIDTINKQRVSYTKKQYQNQDTPRWNWLFIVIVIIVLWFLFKN